MQKKRAGEQCMLATYRDGEELIRVCMISIRPGGTVVEGTAGNTGIGLAHVCRSRGYKCVIFMPDTQVSWITSVHMDASTDCL